MSLWESSKDEIIRISMSDRALEIPIQGDLDLGMGGHRGYMLRLFRKNGDCSKCAQTSDCHNNCCCTCCHESGDDGDFEVRFEARGITAAGDMRFVLPDELFERGKGRYEGAFITHSDGECGEEDNVICPFVLILDDFLCLDFKRAKVRAVNISTLGGCDVES